MILIKNVLIKTDWNPNNQHENVLNLAGYQDYTTIKL